MLLNVVKSAFCVEHLKALTELKLTPSGSLFHILITRSQNRGCNSFAVCFIKFILITSSVGDTKTALAPLSTTIC